MQRIQAEIDEIENKKINLLEAKKLEKKLKREVKKLNFIFNNYIAEFSDDSVDETAHTSQNAQLKNIMKTLTGVGIDKSELQKIIQEKGVEGFLNNYKDIMKGSLNALKEGFDINMLKQKMNIGARQSTNVQEFSLGKRAKKSKGTHPIYAFTSELKKLIDDGKITVKANQPLKSILKEFSLKFDEKIKDDPTNKTNIIEFY